MMNSSFFAFYLLQKVTLMHFNLYHQSSKSPFSNIRYVVSSFQYLNICQDFNTSYKNLVKYPTTARYIFPASQASNHPCTTWLAFQDLSPYAQPHEPVPSIVMNHNCYPTPAPHQTKNIEKVKIYGLLKVFNPIGCIAFNRIINPFGIKDYFVMKNLFH